MYASYRRIVFALLALSISLLSVFVVRAEEAANDGDDYYSDDQIQQADEEAKQDNNNGAAAYNNYVWQGDDYIQYWTEFAIYPKRCIV